MKAGNSYGTPKEQEIEKIISTKRFTQMEAAKLLRKLSVINEEMKSTIHYHSNHYIEYLIESNETLIESFK